MPSVSEYIPSMFHRRLLLLGVLLLLGTAVLGAKLSHLTLIEGQEHLQQAESVLKTRTLLPTLRGRILDRHGRVLAAEAASYDVAIHYDLITGTWQQEQARHRARQSYRGDWDRLSDQERRQRIDEHLPHFQEIADDIWTAILEQSDLEPEQLQQKRDSITSRIERMAESVHRRQREEAERRHPGSGRTFKPQPILEQTISHVILPRVETSTAFTFMHLADRYAGRVVGLDAGRSLIEVHDSRRRVHPWSSQTLVLERSFLPRDARSQQPIRIEVVGVADHLLGLMRDEVWQSDVILRPFLDNDSGEIVDLGGYRVGDVVGMTGIERVFEDTLRGSRGVIDERRDTGVVNRIDPVPGSDVRLTIDIALQQQVQAILSDEYGLTVVQPWHGNDILPQGTPMNSSAVVLDINSSEILSAVSMPTLAMAEDMDDLQRAMSVPTINRPFEAMYPPGSIVKPLILTAAVTADEHDVDHAIECTGHYFEHVKDSARCWIYREQYGFQTHGALQAAEAVARSCNIYFYTLAEQLGIDGVLEWLEYFGLGHRLHCGLAYENAQGNIAGVSAGMTLDGEELAAIVMERSHISTAIFMGIGQGPIAWTPLHAANAYAMLARGGSVRDATLVAEPPVSSRDKRAADRALAPDAVREALQGLRDSASEPHGTGHHITYDDGRREPIINAQGVTVWSKTGTAQAPPMKVDNNGDGKIDKADDEPVAGLDHAWWVGMVAPEGSGTPQYAIAVLVEYGGSGGRVAGPVANAIIHAMQNTGYLPGVSR